MGGELMGGLFEVIIIVGGWSGTIRGLEK